MDAKHTPAPWVVAPAHRGGVYALDELHDCDAQAVANCDGDRFNPRPLEECYANARLIAAAPDMLAALHVLVELCQHATFFAQCSEVALAEAVIAKAEGRQ